MHQAPLRLFLAVVVAVSATLPMFAAPASAAPIAPIDPALQQQMAAQPGALLPVIVEMQHGPPTSAVNLQLAQQALSLLRLNGVARGALALISSAAGLANAKGITAISLVPGVAYIHADAAVRGHADVVRPVDTYPRAIEADRVWAANGSGRGVTVAVLDSGIAPDADLMQRSARILARANFADALGDSFDPGGHGTHVAGTIAGDGARSDGEYVGVAPNANVVDVRVLDKNGNGRMSSVIVGIQWALDHRVQYGIRVLNLSLGAPTRTPYRLDPMAAAVEMAWLRGLVVVTASGNTAGSVDSPGTDPYVITVGATDDRATDTVADDVVGWFSGYGTPPGSTAKPELVAPGRRIVSLRSPGSALERALPPDRIVAASNGATYFRLSGTSMSTAVVSGAVALLLERQPALSPDQVKSVLMASARPFGQASGIVPNRAAVGAGSLDAWAAVGSGIRTRGNRANQPADATAQSLYPAVYGQRLVWKNPLLGGRLWNLLGWDNLAWDNLAWDNLAWDNLAWDNLAWDNLAWDNLAWDNLAWDNIAWDSQTLD